MSEGSKKTVHDALSQLCDVITNETMLSSYEIQTSGLVTALNNCLNKVKSFVHQSSQIQ